MIGILNQAGNQIVSYTYDAWGKLLSVDGTEAATIGQLNPIRYRGYYYDTETGFYYLQSRYYDPITKRFLNADNIAGLLGDDQSHNIFAYCRNNPINLVDPTGHYSWGEFWNDLKGGLRLAVKVAIKAVKTANEVVLSNKFEAGVGIGLRAGAKASGIGGTVGGNYDILNLKINRNELSLGTESSYGASLEVDGVTVNSDNSIYHPYSCDRYPEDIKNRHSIESCPNSVITTPIPQMEFTIASVEFYALIGANVSWTLDIDSLAENIVEIWSTDW